MRKLRLNKKKKNVRLLESRSNLKREATMGLNDYVIFGDWEKYFSSETAGWIVPRKSNCYEENDCLVRNWKVASVSKI